MTLSIIAFALSITAIFISILGLAVATYGTVKFLGFLESKHTVQMVPIDSPEARSPGDDDLGDLDEKLQAEYADIEDPLVEPEEDD